MSVLLLTGCSGSTRLDKATTTLASPGSWVTQSCARPNTVPNNVTNAQVEILWAGDRKSLILCRASKDHVVSFFSKRDGKVY